MTSAPLATPWDIEGILGRDLTDAESARVDAVLTKLSELFRAESGQQFTPGTSTTRLKVNGGQVYLPQRPAGEITTVTDERGEPVSFRRVSPQYIAVPLSSASLVWVTYSHGSDTVPPLVVSAIADDARQVLQIAPEAVSGLAQTGQTGGPYSENASFATWAQGGSTRLSFEGLKVAHSFRVRHGNVWVAQ